MKARQLTRETILSLGVQDRQFPEFRVGDTVAISKIVKEGEKERIQLFQGDVISFKRNGIASTFTVRRASANAIFVERIFPYYSPMVSDIKVVRRARVRRAKLYYLRNVTGKAAKLKERVLTKEQKAHMNDTSR